MRLFQYIKQGLAISMGLTLMTGLAAAQPQPEFSRGATIMRLQGKARFSTDNKSWQPAKNGMVLGAGAIIQTGGNSTVDLRLGRTEANMDFNSPDAGIVRLAPDSVLAIDTLSTETGSNQTVELDLRSGEITGRVGQLQAGSHYEVKFSAGVAGIRDGLYRMNSAGYVDAINGEAIVASVGPDGTAVAKIVSAGHRFYPGTGAMTELTAMASNNQPVSKREPAPESQAAIAPTNPPQRAPGLGGSFRKF